MIESAVSAMKSFDRKPIKMMIHSKLFNENHEITGAFQFCQKNGRVGFICGRNHISLKEQSLNYSQENAKGHFFYDDFTEITIFEIKQKVFGDD